MFIARKKRNLNIKELEHLYKKKDLKNYLITTIILNTFNIFSTNAITTNISISTNIISTNIFTTTTSFILFTSSKTSI